MEKQRRRSGKLDKAFSSAASAPFLKQALSKMGARSLRQAPSRPSPQQDLVLPVDWLRPANAPACVAPTRCDRNPVTLTGSRSPVVNPFDSIDPGALPSPR